jgi:hypothetical protein
MPFGLTSRLNVGGKIMTRRIVALALLLAALAALMLWPQQPRAAYTLLPACDSEREFYSDATFSTQVGDWNVTCHGVTHSGHSSCYYIHSEYGPCGNAECSDLSFVCTNGTITSASNPAYVGQSCGCVPVF